MLDSAAEPRANTTCDCRIDASQRNQTADSSISHDASQGWFFFLARVVALTLMLRISFVLLPI